MRSMVNLDLVSQGFIKSNKLTSKYFVLVFYVVISCNCFSDPYFSVAGDTCHLLSIKFKIFIFTLEVSNSNVQYDTSAEREMSSGISLEYFFSRPRLVSSQF